LGTAAVYALGAYLFRADSISVGSIFVVAYYLGLLINPLLEIARQSEDMQKANAGIARVQELFSIRSTLHENVTATLDQGALPVTFDDVTFAYGNDEPVLRDLSLNLPAGHVLGVLGRTGSGKTTLTRLLFRLYDPNQGSIRLADTDVRDLALRDLRRRVGIVTQEVQIFHASLRANLTFFDETILDAKIINALEEVGLGDWYRSLPDGLDTVLAGGHGGLSAGEAQLLAFTRIFLRDPGVVILDEASSRLDPATEQLIEHAVDKLLRNRTGIIIAHRLDTIKRADDILILEAGRVREYGSRIALLQEPQSRFNALLRTGMKEALE
jgi:ATP-binding cassette subfamily B protein